MSELKPDLLKSCPRWAGKKPEGTSDEAWFGALEYWLKSFQSYATKVGIQDDDLSKYVTFVLEPHAGSMLPSTAFSSWATFEKAAKLIWGIKGGSSTVLSRLAERKQHPGEPIGSFIGAHQHLVGLLEGDLAKPELHLPQFRANLLPKVREFLIGKSGLTTVAEIGEMVGELEAVSLDDASLRGPTHAEAQVAWIGKGPRRDRKQQFGGRDREERPRRQPAAKVEAKDRFQGCFVCGEEGHRAAQCHLRATEPSARPGSKKVAALDAFDAYSQPKRNSGITSRRGARRPPIVKMKIRDVGVDALLDSGAEVSCMETKLAKRLRLRPRPSSKRLRTANGTEMPHCGIVASEATVAGKESQLSCFVADRLPAQVLLGRDAAETWGLVPLPHGGVGALGEQGEAELRLPDGEYVVRGRVEDDELIASVIRERKNPAVLQECKIGDALPHLRGKVIQLLQEFVDVMREDADDIGTANVEPMRIRLKAELKPFAASVQPLPWAHQEWVDKEIERLLRATPPRISASTSKVCSNAHVVVKPEGDGTKMRFVANFKPYLNPQIETDRHPCADGQRIFDELGAKTVCFHKIDMADAFFQMPIAEEDRYLTSFVVKKGQYQFNYVPFGIKPAPAKLQRELDQLFRGLERCYGAADDWILAPESEQEALDGLREFLMRCRRGGWLLKPSKCYFLQRQVQFMGRQLTPTSCGPDEDSKQALLRLPRPSNAAELEEYLGLARWYAPFVPNFAAKAAALFELIKETGVRLQTAELKSKYKRKAAASKIPLPWRQEHDEAFRLIHEGVMKALPLQHIQRDKKCTVITDASRKGFGAILMQEGKTVKIAHRSLKPHERDMPITLLELSALIFAVKKWHCFLAHNKFDVVTDHKALTWLRGLKPSSGKLAEWAYEMDQYDFDIIYRKGVDLGLADTISRIEPVVAAVVDASEMVPTPEEFKKAQALDPDCTQIISNLRAGHRETLDKFVLDVSGILCKLESRHGYPVLKVVVPPGLRKRVIMAVHVDSAHRDAAETARRTALMFWWRAQGEEAVAIARTCMACQERKPPPRARQLPRGVLIAARANQVVDIDILSGLPPSNKHPWQYVLLACDRFTKEIRLRPLKSKSSAETAAVFESMWIKDFGPPEACHSDQGGEFWGHEFKALMRKYNIRKTWTTDYHPQGDGQAERNMGTVAASIATTLHGPRDGWPDALQKVQDGFNTSRHSFTRYAPVFLSKGVEPMALTRKLVIQPKPTPSEEEARRKELERARSEVARRFDDKQAAADRYNNSRKRAPSFRVGELVMLRVQATMEAKFSKINRPFVLCRVLAKGRTESTYVIRQLRGPIAGTVNVANLKEFRTDQDMETQLSGHEPKNTMHSSVSSTSERLGGGGVTTGVTRVTDPVQASDHDASEDKPATEKAPEPPKILEETSQASNTNTDAETELAIQENTAEPANLEIPEPTDPEPTPVVELPVPSTPTRRPFTRLQARTLVQEAHMALNARGGDVRRDMPMEDPSSV